MDGVEPERDVERWKFRHDTGSKRFEHVPVFKDGSEGAASFIEYVQSGHGIVDMFETFVPPLYRGKGRAEEMAKAAFQFCKDAGIRVIASCSYLGTKFLDRNIHFGDLVVHNKVKDEVGLAKGRKRKRTGKSRQPVSWDFEMGRPVEGRVHLMPFLLPTRFCDSMNTSIVDLSKQIIPEGATALEAAVRVRNWVRTHIVYVFDKKDVLASETLHKREGMCTNKANLQVAILRAAGIPSGYVFAHITKEVYNIVPGMVNEEIYKGIADPTVHCFAAAYEDGCDRFCYYDATEKLQGPPRENLYLKENLETGESQFWRGLLRGPFSDVQANIDHLLEWEFPSKISDEVRDEQNAKFRKSKHV